MIGLRRWVTGLVMMGVLGVAAGVSGCGATADSGAVATDSAPTTIPSTASSAAPASSGPAASISSSMPSANTGAVSSSNPVTGATSMSVPTTATSGTSAGAPSVMSSTAGTLPGGRLTLTGTVESGVEPRCLILEDEKTGLRVNITGGNPLVRVGARITVVGQIRKDLMSYCQQGPIFEVITATKP